MKLSFFQLLHSNQVKSQVLPIFTFALFLILFSSSSFFLSSCTKAKANTPSVETIRDFSKAEYSNKAFMIKKGKLILKEGYAKKKFSETHLIIYNTENWIIKYVGNQWTATNIEDAGCNPACGDGYMCVNGSCVQMDPCGGTCPPGTVCNQGSCVPISACTPPCNSDELCVQGQCQPINEENECSPACADGEVCVCVQGTCECSPAPDGPAEVITVMY